MTKLDHPNISCFKHIIANRNTLTMVSEYFDAPGLIKFISMENQYISEKIIASIAT